MTDMNESRRRFIENIVLASSGVVALGVGGWPSRYALAYGASSRLGNPLRIVPEHDGSDLNARVARQFVYPDKSTNVWTYGNGMPSPTIRVRRGDRFTARLVNSLHEPTNIHWHGLLVPADMDGHPASAVAPYLTKDFDFVVNQRSGLYWYHPHVHMLTAKQVYLGMAGLFVVEDPEDERFGLPNGDREVLLVLQDKRIDESREVLYDPSMSDLMSGMLGNVALTNGTPEAFLDVSRDLFRLRMLNASNARVMKLGFDNGATFHLIGGDGGLLERPYPMTTLWLGPAERADILVDFSSLPIGASTVLKSLPYDNVPDFTWQGWGLDFLRFDVTREATASTIIPQELEPVVQLDPISTSRSRLFTLEMVHQIPNMKHVINGREYEMDRIDVRVAAGSTEVWMFANEDDEPHPMHLHGAQFQVFERNGASTTDPKDEGWKDTVLIGPDQTASVVVRFAEHVGTFVAHCHNLEHEDTGMMLNFEVEPPASVRQESGSDAVSIVSITPHPVSVAASITFVLQRASEVRIRVFDLAGRGVLQSAETEYPSGRHSIEFETSRLAPGRYHVMIEAAGAHASEPMFIVR